MLKQQCTYLLVALMLLQHVVLAIPNTVCILQQIKWFISQKDFTENSFITSEIKILNEHEFWYKGSMYDYKSITTDGTISMVVAYKDQKHTDAILAIKKHNGHKCFQTLIKNSVESKYTYDALFSFEMKEKPLTSEPIYQNYLSVIRSGFVNRVIQPPNLVVV